MKYAPVIIPTLCRSVHFIRLIESLKRNEWAKYTDIYISLDLPTQEKHKKGWKEINDYVDNGDFSVFASFNVLKQKVNRGWVYNMLYICDYISPQYDRWIYLEDDGEVSPNFIEYIDKCLDYYENDNQVYGVCGFMFPVKWNVSPDATCLKQNVNASVWGLGLWRDKFYEMREYIKTDKLLDNVNKCIKEQSYKKMIDACIRDYIPGALSPARFLNRFMRDWTDMSMRAYLAVEDKYCISPVVPKVRNWGFDGSGSSSGNTDAEGGFVFSKQEIDTNTSFELVPDTYNTYEQNRERLNLVDIIPDNQLVDAKREIWLCENYGIWSGKLYATIIAMPKLIISRVCNKIKKQ